jgi:hypothetical protein
VPAGAARVDQERRVAGIDDHVRLVGLDAREHAVDEVGARQIGAGEAEHALAILQIAVAGVHEVERGPPAGPPCVRHPTGDRGHHAVELIARRR